MITHPEKLLFPDDGITKGDLADYYERLAPVMLPHVAGRPLTMERYPAGIGTKGFWQKDVSRGAPDWLERVTVPKKGGTVHHALINDERALLWMANQNTVTPHVWVSRVPRLKHPDLCVFDLDPMQDDEEMLVRYTLVVRDFLDRLGLKSWVKTTGSKGFHIVVPLAREATTTEVVRFAGRVAERLIQQHPEALTTEFAKADRGGRILIDTGRNAYSATFAAPYAVRARAGAPVSAPCRWSEIESRSAGPRTFTLKHMAARLDAVGDPWSAIYDDPQDLRAAAARLTRTR